MHVALDVHVPHSTGATNRRTGASNACARSFGLPGASAGPPPVACPASAHAAHITQSAWWGRVTGTRYHQVRANPPRIVRLLPIACSSLRVPCRGASPDLATRVAPATRGAGGPHARLRTSGRLPWSESCDGRGHASRALSLPPSVCSLYERGVERF